jgi:hypothetical protein
MRHLVPRMLLLWGLGCGCFDRPSCLAQALASGSPVIRGIRLTSDKVHLDIDPAVPWSWETVTFKSRQTFPAQLPTLPPTRHQLTFGQFEPGVMEWFQYDFIRIGTYEVVDDHHIRVKVLDGSDMLGTFDPLTHTLVFDGLEYDPVIRMPAFRILTSQDLRHWEPVATNPGSVGEQVWSVPVRVTLPRDAGAVAFFRVMRMD